MKFLKTLLLLTLVFTIGCKDKKAPEVAKTATTEKLPNIIIIYSDDLGYGDVSANGATEISTPNIDKLANGGVRFTNGYATSATCTPSRYGLLTGVYPWRNKNAKILPGTAPLIISTEQTTIPKMLKTKGYQTGIVGKWHLGLGTGIVDWNKKITPSPNEVGFDYSFIMAATQDRVPTVYIKDGNVVNLDPNDPLEVNYKKNFKGQPTGKDNPELTTLKWHHGHNSSIVNGIPRIGYMKGGESAKWQDTTMAETFLNKAQDYVKQHKDKPFFLYYALRQPHVPRTPSPKFVGKSGMGPRGDVILEADWCIGEFMKTLEDEGLLENTLIVFSSDNGPVLNDGYYDDAVEKLGNHSPTGGLRGGKYSLFEAGTKVPFFTYWKGKIQPTVSNALICQLDLLSSLSKLVNSDITTGDSQENLDVFMGKSMIGRKDLVLEANRKTAYRNGDWALIPPYSGSAVLSDVNIEIGNSKEYQLYNIKKDRAQQKNVAKTNPKKLAEMIAGYTAIRGEQKGEIKEVELK
ncbi:sulfatase-like hydrolase/transferase [Lutibacter citreus]|uniref:sulfatase-like hydrolase/transferase n=1 Tax=Lutibacter citreus TaxID=2138210 RepID=UPI000DBE96EA|nr:sulfatase-like hydrolase/transferase [Lutibacter citreus]